MVTIELQDKKYECPTNWKEVTIKNYYNIIKILKTSDGQLRKNLKIIELISNIPIDLLYEMNVDNINKIPLDFLNEMPAKEKELKIIKINGIEYGIIPNLKYITLGEFADLDELCKKPEENFIDIISIILRPIKNKKEMDGKIISYDVDKYNIKELEFRKKLFEDNLDIESAFSITNFFLFSETGYLKNMTNYLSKIEKKVKKMKKKMKKKDGVG